MRGKIIAVFTSLLLTACQPATPAAMPSATPTATSANCPTGDHMEELTSGGQLRQYGLHVPSAYRPEKPMALVLGFHGAG